MGLGRCAVDGCARPVVALMRCDMHYRRARRRGGLPSRSPIARLVNKIVIDVESGCWVYTGSLTRSAEGMGYGQMSVEDRSVLTHRFAYVTWRGVVPDGMFLDHLCRNRSCCNPWHLEAVTHAENVARSPIMGRNHSEKTHCPQGHPYDEENTYRRRGKPGRSCRACQRATGARMRAYIRIAKSHLGLTWIDYVARYGTSRSAAAAALVSVGVDPKVLNGDNDD